MAIVQQAVKFGQGRLKRMPHEQRLKHDPDYASRFNQAFDDELIRQNPALAERLTSGKPFNRKQTIPGAPVYQTGSYGTGLKVNATKPGQVPLKVVAQNPVKSVAKPHEPVKAKRGDNLHLLGSMEKTNSLFGRVGATSKVLTGSARHYFGKEGAKSAAWRGTVQSTAASAAIHGGLAYVQGDDPWEAAKTGAVRGALGGAGYQGLKAATHAPGTGVRGIKGNLKHMGSTVSQTYKAHTITGRAAMGQNGGMSRQLETVLKANQMSRLAQNQLGLK